MTPSFQCRGSGQTRDGMFRDRVREGVRAWGVRRKRSVVDDPSWIFSRLENARAHIEELTAWGVLRLEDFEGLTGADHSAGHVHVHHCPEGFGGEIFYQCGGMPHPSILQTRGQAKHDNHQSHLPAH